MIKIFRYVNKTSAAQLLDKVFFSRGKGIDGDYHCYDEFPISLMSKRLYDELENSVDKGICYKKFKPNIVMDFNIVESDTITIKEAEFKAIKAPKRCHSDLCDKLDKNNCLFKSDIYYLEVIKCGEVVSE